MDFRVEHSERFQPVDESKFQKIGVQSNFGALFFCVAQDVEDGIRKRIVVASHHAYIYRTGDTQLPFGFEHEGDRTGLHVDIMAGYKMISAGAASTNEFTHRNAAVSL